MITPDLIQAFKDNVSEFYDISYESLHLLKEITEVKELKAGTILENVGDIPNSVYVIIDGYCRSYFVNEKGKEFTKAIYKPLDIFTSFNAIIKQIPADCYYATLTKCTVIVTNYNEYINLREQHPDILKFHFSYLENVICQNDVRHKELLSMNATERYLSLRKQIPNIDNLIPQYQIATYLSITPVQLSRIRNKLNH